MLIYLDSNIVVYLVEDLTEFSPQAAGMVARLADQGHRFAVSHLVRMECRVGALRSDDPSLIQAYESFFDAVKYRILDFPSEVFDHAADIRATHRVAALDALHLAAAVAGGCDAFLTNDTSLASFDEIAVILLSSTLPPEV